jgi:DNA-directed RNA polymerase specialized sigma24 family protein
MGTFRSIGLEDPQAFDIIHGSGARCPSPGFIIATITVPTARRADFRSILDEILKGRPPRFRRAFLLVYPNEG